MWCEILYNFIGAFFGFGFAIIVELWFSNKSEKEMQAKVKQNIIGELEILYDDLQRINENKSNPEYFRYQYIVWEACVNSGYLFSVSGTKIYEEYINIYTKIIFANELEKQYFDMLIIGQQNQKEMLNKMNQERLIRREDILNNLANICKKEE